MEWRRNKVLELASHGLNQSEISRTLQISQPTINRDFVFLRQQAKQNNNNKDLLQQNNRPTDDSIDSLA